MDVPNDVPAPATDETRRRLTRRLFFGLPLLAGALAAHPSVAQAGTATSTWKMEGNSDVDDNDFLGSKNDKSLVFKTKNIERMRITNGGRVGIGTASPANTLHVVAPSGGITGIRGESSSTDARAAGVLGQVTASTPGETAAGVKGVMIAPPPTGYALTGGYGVWGEHRSNGIGVYGQATELGLGVLGVSGPAESTAGQLTISAGVQGLGITIGVYGRGTYAGVEGVTSVDYGCGVRGATTITGGTGVEGRAEGPTDQDGVGDFSAAHYGVAGITNCGFGVIGTSTGTHATGVHATGEGIGAVGHGGLAGLVGAGLVGAIGISGVDIPGEPRHLGPYFLSDIQALNAPLGDGVLGGVGMRGAGGRIGVAGSAHMDGGIGVLGVAPVADAVATGYALYGKALSADAYAGFFEGKVQVTGSLQVGEGEAAQHVSTTAQPLLSFSGNAVLDGSGAATVTLPAGSPALSDVRYQLTAVGGSAPGLYIAQELSGGAFGIAGGAPGLKVSWRLEGLRP